MSTVGSDVTGAAALIFAWLFVGTAQLASAAPQSVPTGKARRPIVGAIRWDGWNEWDVWQRAFDPPEWRHRLPFFAKIGRDGRAIVREDTQKVIDKEIVYAKSSGLDYWAFVWYHPDGWPPHSAHMAKCFQLYLSSRHKRDINYSLILAGGVHLGPKERLPETMDYLVKRFTDRNYQKVLGNRPLVYLFQTADLTASMGSDEAARAWLDDLRSKAVAAGLGSPYYVVMTFWPPQGAEQVEKLGCDALGTYAGFAPGKDDREHPYSVLVDHNRTFWEACKATGKQVVPTVNVGWDYRPMKQPEPPELMQGRDLKADWVAAATPREMADHLRGALRWVDDNPTASPARAVLIYAWNELSEGGWLVPTLSEKSARLDALKKVLKAKPALRPARGVRMR